MKRPKIKSCIVFILGMLAFPIGWFFVSTFVFVKRPKPPEIVEDWKRICFWSDEGGIMASVSPKGCYSPTCTRPTMQSGTAVVDAQNYQIQIETRFSLDETSRFPLPCVESCEGGGTILFNLGPLVPNDYDVLFRGKEVGKLMVFSGRVTPRQCFENTPGSGAQTIPNTRALDPNVHVNASGSVPGNPLEETQTSLEDSPTDLCLQVKTTEMPVSKTLDQTNEEIAAQLYSQYLEGYQSAALPDFCRLNAFDVKGVKVDPTLVPFKEEMGVDFMAWVRYSVQPVAYGLWMAGNGISGEDGWVLDKWMIVGLTRAGEVIKLTIHGTGP